MTKKSLILVARTMVLIALTAPVAAYVLTFGTSITANHERWAEMGDAMAGIYTPILTVLTLIVLAYQVNLQSRLNRHTFDESYVQNARNDIGFYLEQLATELDKRRAGGTSVGAFITTNFAKDLPAEERRTLAQDFNRTQQRVLALWSSFYTVLGGLAVNEWHPYSLALVTARQRAIALLTFETCVALDNYMSCVTDGRLGGAPQFARVESPRKL
jgi:hypothetical protein